MKVLKTIHFKDKSIGYDLGRPSVGLRLAYLIETPDILCGSESHILGRVLNFKKLSAELLQLLIMEQKLIRMRFSQKHFKNINVFIR